MKNSILITIIVIAIVIIAVIVGFLMMQYQTTIPKPSPTPTPSPSASQTYNIVISGFAFSPASLTIKKGDTIIWTNQDSVRHTVTSDSGAELDSSLLLRGATYSHKFNTAGTFNYHCTPHPYMKATITVE